ncbi:MAG TPA: phytanoyl-CoA dioxygenase family protein, partial [Bryobacteraceae bacterium]
IPLEGSTHQDLHADYQRPLFEELPDLQLPAYMMVVSFPLTRIQLEDGPIEIVPGTHRLPREAVSPIEPVLLDPGDVLVRHPWTLHRGTPNRTSRPRLLCTIRYTRRWYWDSSRDVSTIPEDIWLSLTPVQREMMRFPYSS